MEATHGLHAMVHVVAESERIPEAMLKDTTNLWWWLKEVQKDRRKRTARWKFTCNGQVG